VAAVCDAPLAAVRADYLDRRVVGVTAADVRDLLPVGRPGRLSAVVVAVACDDVAVPAVGVHDEDPVREARGRALTVERDPAAVACPRRSSDPGQQLHRMPSVEVDDGQVVLAAVVRLVGDAVAVRDPDRDESPRPQEHVSTSAVHVDGLDLRISGRAAHVGDRAVVRRPGGLAVRDVRPLDVALRGGRRRL
jgi:hypothetical protein